jgi:hypothetical protein
MLKITVSIVPGGVGPERRLGELHIANVGGGEFADYACTLHSDDLPAPVRVTLARYPRWSATVWDLVARALAKALSGSERLPRRPARLAVPMHHDGSVAYVRLSDIPEPARSAFERRMRGSTVPVIPGEGDCAYSWDWLGFISGGRWK